MRNKAYKYVKPLIQDIEAGMLRQGTPTAKNHKGSFKRGCWIGCVLRDYSHERMAETLQWPLLLVHITESIFEALYDEPETFAVDVLKAPKPDARMDMVPWQFLQGEVAQALAGKTLVETRKEYRPVLEALDSDLDTLTEASLALQQMWASSAECLLSTTRASNPEHVNDQAARLLTILAAAPV